MSHLSDYRLLTFDVYGTLVDWETGILTALSPLLSHSTLNFTPEQTLSIYQEHESKQQTLTPDMAYSTLLTTIHPGLAKSFSAPPPTADDSAAFGASIGTWPAFPDTVDALRRLSRRYKLVVLSNVDRASFAKTNEGSLQGFPFDLIITAEDIGSYKPDPRNFEYMLRAVEEQFGAAKGEVLQTAQSQFHDHHPAKKVGIKSVWIERAGATMGNMEEKVFDWRFGTLREMADAVDEGV